MALRAPDFLPPASGGEVSKSIYRTDFHIKFKNNNRIIDYDIEFIYLFCVNCAPGKQFPITCRVRDLCSFSRNSTCV